MAFDPFELQVIKVIGENSYCGFDDIVQILTGVTGVGEKVNLQMGFKLSATLTKLKEQGVVKFVSSFYAFQSDYGYTLGDPRNIVRSKLGSE